MTQRYWYWAWHTAYATHRVPEAIVKLALAANRAAGKPTNPPNDGKGYLRWMRTPAFKVVAEWGAWREAEDEREYQAQKAA